MNTQNITNFYWQPIKEITSSVEKYCKKNNYQTVLEIGPGIVPFTLSTSTIGYNEKIKNYIELDIDIQKLPFEDKSVDFVYSRHTLEDIQNPDFCMKEIIRISNSGYIETPSPLIECTKGVDGHPKSNNYSGYIHHRYIIWSDIEKCEIYFLPKYNSILDNHCELTYESNKNKNDIINNNPIYWNNYFIWKNNTPRIIVYKNGVNFGVNKSIIEDYREIIDTAINTSIRNTNYFIKEFCNNL